MRKLIIGLWMVLAPMMVYATWQVTNPFRSVKTLYPVDPAIGKTDYPDNYANDPEYLLQLNHGSLRENIERYANQTHWTVFWRTANHFHTLLNTKITGPSFPIVLNKLLYHYPLYAKYDDANQVAWIFPRTVK